ncbi:MAG: Asp-tRNA(Asn)/Glu-tRNA(Gln) amidotransferase GatCAB subunit B, partial [Dehalococcoidia bacterium]|nr:Asp-tRNA(Asn)/Glu-tRNA(Gln) amidotransferase GatCAB subunit B [Dehalococcoidia bacterium]
FEDGYGLSSYEAGLLTASPELADYFERAVATGRGHEEGGRQAAKSASNWLLGEFSRLVNSAGIKISEVRIPPEEILALQDLVDNGTLNSSMAKAVLAEMFESGRPASQVARDLGMVQISDVAAVQAAVDQAVESNPKAVADYLGGKETALRFLVGQVMRVTRGKANPNVAADLLQKRLEWPPDR